MMIVSLVRLVRPIQWLKNLMLFFPPFLSGSLLSPTLVNTGAEAFTAFCLVSSATYIFNDLRDSEQDAAHPLKNRRPVASGAVSRRSAAFFAMLLGAFGIGVGILVPGIFIWYLLAYLAVSTCYSFKLKELAVVDLFCISAGFLLRLKAGGAVFGVVVSDWLFLSVLFLSLFLSTGKRLSELNALGDLAFDHRISLRGYPQGTLEGFLYLTGATALLTYAMYSLPHQPLVYTVPLCTFGLFRYIVLVKSGSSGDPTESLMKDFPLFCVAILWVILVGWSIY